MGDFFVVSCLFLTVGQCDYGTMGDFLLFRVSKSQGLKVSMPPATIKKRKPFILRSNARRSLATSPPLPKGDLGGM